MSSLGIPDSSGVAVRYVSPKEFAHYMQSVTFAVADQSAWVEAGLSVKDCVHKLQF